MEKKIVLKSNGIDSSKDLDIYKSFLNEKVRIVKRETNQLFTIKGILKQFNSRGVLIEVDNTETRFIPHQSINEIIKLGGKNEKRRRI